MNNFAQLKRIPHYWGQTDILQHHHFQYQLFQLKSIFSSIETFRLLYQLISDKINQVAFLKFPPQLHKLSYRHQMSKFSFMLLPSLIPIENIRLSVVTTQPSTLNAPETFKNLQLFLFSLVISIILELPKIKT